MSKRSDRLGPPVVTISQLILKTFAGATAGVAGTLVFFSFFLLSSTILKPTFTAGADTTHPLFIFMFITMIFLAALTSGLLAVLFMSMTDRERYGRFASSMYQTFIIQLVILVFATPFYLSSSALGLEVAAYMAGVHVVISVIATSMILEILGDHEYSLLGVYSVVFATLVSVGLAFVFYQMAGENVTILMFVAFPLMWTTVGLFNGVFGALYHYLFRSYGFDFLSAQTNLGQDYGIEKRAEEEEEDKGPGDQSGADFLKK